MSVADLAKYIGSEFSWYEQVKDADTLAKSTDITGMADIFGIVDTMFIYGRWRVVFSFEGEWIGVNFNIVNSNVIYYNLRTKELIPDFPTYYFLRRLFPKGVDQSDVFSRRSSWADMKPSGHIVFDRDYHHQTPWELFKMTEGDFFYLKRGIDDAISSKVDGMTIRRITDFDNDTMEGHMRFGVNWIRYRFQGDAYIFFGCREVILTVASDDKNIRQKLAEALAVRQVSHPTLPGVKTLHEAQLLDF